MQKMQGGPPMQIPKSVKIGYRTYDIRVLPPHEMPTSEKGVPLLGEIRYEYSVIDLNNRLTTEQLFPILLHEMFHGILYMCGRTEVSDETLCNALSENFAQIIVDNPSLFTKEVI
jgi:hypothetical protein